jgi:methionyl-tRNA formyltransferase
MKAVFFGSSDISLPFLEATKYLFDVVLIVTQPDKRKGRGRGLVSTPVVKEYAIKQNIPFVQPMKTSEDKFLDVLKEVKADIYVIVSYGKIISAKALQHVKLAPLNVHTSLLPDLRGASPIYEAIRKGYKKTGVTLMCINERMDEGDLLLQKSFEINSEDMYVDVEEKMVKHGVELLKEFAKKPQTIIEQKKLQVHQEATYCCKINKEDMKIRWADNAISIWNMFRAGLGSKDVWTYMIVKNKRIRVALQFKGLVEANCDYEIGSLIKQDNGDVIAVCGHGLINISMIKPEGKRWMDMKSFSSGYPLQEWNSDITISESFCYFERLIDQE